MKMDARSLSDGTHLSTDICLIGAGIAGITLAKELNGDRLNVLLLESGGLEYEDDTQSLYSGESTGLPYPPLTKCRLRYFGGTSGMWGGWCAALDPEDFAKMEWIPYSGWPITYEDLVPWYTRASQICQLHPSNIHSDFWETRISSGSRRAKSDTLATKMIRLGPPTRFGTAYRDELLCSKNVTVCTHATVTDIRSNPAASHVTAVRVSTLSGLKMTVTANKYVLACGGLENPRLLLLSDSTVREGLGNQRDLVGRFFMEHPHIGASEAILPDDPSYPSLYQLFGNGYVPLLTILPHTREQHRMGNYTTFVMPGTPSAMHTRIEQVPNPVSRVTLSDSAVDALGRRQISLHWELSELDKRTLRIGEQLVADEFERLEYGRVRTQSWVLDEANRWPQHEISAPHHMGTTRMGRTPQDSVVNSDCKVHGIDNLFVAGSSVFTTSGAANPTLTIVALAARLAAHLKRTYDAGVVVRTADYPVPER